jgi:hypothetical protein
MALSGVQLSWRLRAKLAPSSVKMYNATSKLVYFEKKYFALKNVLTYYLPTTVAL